VSVELLHSRVDVGWVMQEYKGYVVGGNVVNRDCKDGREVGGIDLGKQGWIDGGLAVLGADDEEGVVKGGLALEGGYDFGKDVIDESEGFDQRRSEAEGAGEVAGCLLCDRDGLEVTTE
jgi:hypothetical protein